MSKRIADRRRETAGLALGALLLLSGSRAARAYMWETTVVVDRPVANLRVTDVYFPKTMRIDWDYSSLGSSPQYEVQRYDPSTSTWTSFGVNLTNRYYADAFAFVTGRAYQYRVRVSSDAAPSMGLPPPPMGADPNQIYGRPVASGNPWTTITATPTQVTAGDNQTVDSRYDLRYGNPTFLNFPFATRTYRGGLYAGWASDPSNVGRSFVNFTLPAPGTGQYAWTGSVNGYFTRMAATGSITVGCQVVSPSWTGSTLTWSNAPALTPSAAAKTVALSWDSNSPVSSWCHWTLAGDLISALTGSGLFAVGLAETSETTNAWAYFAKKEYDSTLAPNALYVLGAPFCPIDVTVSPSTITGGNSANGTVYLNAPAPAGGTTVTLGSAAPATAPASVTVPQGARSAPFTVTTTTVSMSTPVTISATANGITQRTTVTVH